MSNVIDKKQVLKAIGKGDSITLELGCGNSKKVAGAIGVDAQDHECVDIVGDVFDVLRQFPEQTVDAVYSFHFFEHVPDLAGLLDEIARVLKVGGRLEIVVPHFSNPYFYSDYTHKTFFGLYTMCYFASESLFRRKVPIYGRAIRYELVEVNLGFKSTRPFYFRHGIKKCFGALFNFSGYMKEFYEENCCNLFPCYEIKYLMNKLR